MKTLKRIILILLVLALCAGSFFVAKKYYGGQKETVVQEVEKIVEVQKEITVSGQTIQSGINDIGVLCTAEYYFEHVENYKDQLQTQGGHNIPFTSASFIYSYDGKITAGIDFTGVVVIKDDNTKTVTISVPKAQIISSEIDEDSFKLYDERNNLFNPISVSDVAFSFADLIKSEEQKAIDSGLLERAQDNADSIIRNFIGSTYSLQDYTITITVA